VVWVPPSATHGAVSWLILSRDLITSMEDFDAAVAATDAAPGYPDAATLIAQLQASIEHDRLADAAAIMCPRGERAELVPPAYARELAARIPSARLEVLAGPGATHALLVERAAELNELALTFLEETERAL
jgi:pimeloyl-ACP methyl ester carboxylesterase